MALDPCACSTAPRRPRPSSAARHPSTSQRGAPGTFRVDFTVSDGLSEATGTARITILPADAPPQLATSPVVAFVHPQQDATLDVFTAVSNPTRRVLLLSDVVGHADEGASLSVDAVGQNYLRVSGTTASGATGRLGTVTYTISDGTDDEGATVEGEATVFLLPPAPQLAPIAVDDTVVVRAGSQIDIPVLDNDIAPSGGKPTLNPASIVSSSPTALAFAGGDVLRYLAPTEPGEYRDRLHGVTRPGLLRSKTPQPCTSRCSPTTPTARRCRRRWRVVC